MRTASNVLIALGLLLFAAFAGILADSALYEKHAEREREEMTREAAIAPAIAAVPAPAPEQGEMIGWLEVPRIGLSVPVAEGTDSQTLYRSVGHIEGTAMPGDSTGNIGIAGHRDIHFRKLRNIRQGDLVRFETNVGEFDYTVDSTEIVTPDRVDVLDPTEKPTLTLVTCYPFYFIGHAPKRFVVHTSFRSRNVAAVPSTPESRTRQSG